MGVSPGMGSYMNQRLLNEETASEFIPGGTEEGILVIWDKKNNIGRAVIINFKWPTLDNTGLTTSEAQRENSIHYFVSAYNGESYDKLITPFTVESSDSRWITLDDLNAIKKGGTSSSSSLAYVKGISADRTRSDVLAVQQGSENGGSTSTGTTTGSSTGTSNGSGTISSSGSVGDSGANVSAATGTTATPAAGNSGKSYEVTEAATTGSDNTPWGTYAVVGILSVMALAGVGFFFKGSLFGR